MFGLGLSDLLFVFGRLDPDLVERVSPLDGHAARELAGRLATFALCSVLFALAVVTAGGAVRTGW